jgi:hypothetical protein
MKTFRVDVNVTNVINLEAFEFNLTYDPYLLEYNSSQISVSYASYSVGLNNGSVRMTANGVPSINGTTTIATITLRLRKNVTTTERAWFVWNTQKPNYTCPLIFSSHSLNGTGSVPIDHEPINGTYLYKPVPGDLDMSGVVDITDLAGAALAFGAERGVDGKYWHDPPCGICPHLPIFDIKVDVENTINILDIVLIARNFGRVEPEP